MIRVLLPIHTVSEANMRGHWTVRARRAKDQRRAAALLVGASVSGRTMSEPVSVVTLTRVYGSTRGLLNRAARKLDDDNLRCALKAVRDGAADALGINDGDERIAWRYRQEQDDDTWLGAWRRGPLCVVEIE